MSALSYASGELRRRGLGLVQRSVICSLTLVLLAACQPDEGVAPNPRVAITANAATSRIATLPFTPFPQLQSGSSGRVYSINDAGSAVGFSSYRDVCCTTIHAVISSMGSIQDIEPNQSSTQSNSYAADINASGVVVGRRHAYPSPAFLATLWSGGTNVQFPPLAGEILSEAIAVNASSDVLAVSAHATFETFYLMLGGVTQQILDPVPGEQVVISDLNNSRDYVLYGVGPNHNGHSAIAGPSGVSWLPEPAGFTSGFATALNNYRQATGWINGAGQVHAAYWSAGQAVDLGNPPGYTQCYGLDINDLGHIVSSCITASGWPNGDGFLWDGVQYSSLGPVRLGPTGNSEYHVKDLSLNNLYQIAGNADVLQSGIWTYPPAPASDLDHDSILDRTDNCLLAPNAGQADFDQDGLGDVCDASPGADLALKITSNPHPVFNSWRSPH